MRGFKKAVAVLLPSIVSSLVLREIELGSVGLTTHDVVIPEGNNGRGIDFRPGDGIIKFSVPCPDCNAEEREALESSSFVLDISQIPQGCASIDGGSGITINGESLPGISQTFSSGSLPLPNIRGAREAASWVTGCGCTHVKEDRTCELGDIVNALFLTLRGFGRGATPTFSVYFKRVNQPEIMQLSLFSDLQLAYNLAQFSSPALAVSSSNTGPEFTFYHSTVIDEAVSSSAASVSVYPSSTSTPLNEIDHATPTFSVGKPALQPSPSTPTHSASEHSSIPTLPIQGFTVQSNNPRLRFGTAFGKLRTTVKNLASQVVEKVKDSRIGCPFSAAQRVSVGSIQAADGHFEVSPYHDTAQPSPLPTSSESALPTGSFAPIPAALTTSSAAAALSTPLPTLAPSTPFAPNAPLSPIPPFIPPTPESLAASETSSSTPSSSHTHHFMLHTPQGILAFKITSVIVIFVCITTAIIAHICANPRRRADRAFRREERRNRCLYRKAARRHKLRNFIQKFRRSRAPPTTNSLIAETWDEKREQALDAQFPTRGNMRNELYAMRSAHRVVDGILRAEEGRCPPSAVCEKVRTRRAERRGNSFSSTRSLGSGLPAYEECEDEVRVVDGFVYTPLGTDCTPDSSVIDTSPRTSLYLRDSDSEKE